MNREKLVQLFGRQVVVGILLAAITTVGLEWAPHVASWMMRVALDVIYAPEEP